MSYIINMHSSLSSFAPRILLQTPPSDYTPSVTNVMIVWLSWGAFQIRIWDHEYKSSYNFNVYTSFHSMHWPGVLGGIPKVSLMNDAKQNIWSTRSKMVMNLYFFCISYMQSIVMSMAYDLCFRWCCFICILKFCFVHWIWSVLGLLMVGCINVCNHWQMQHRICVCMLNFARKCLGEYNIMMKLCIRIFDGAFI